MSKASFGYHRIFRVAIYVLLPVCALLVNYQVSKHQQFFYDLSFVWCRLLSGDSSKLIDGISINNVLMWIFLHCNAPLKHVISQVFL